MFRAARVVFLPVCFIAATFFWSRSTGVFIPNLSEGCYRCLCHVSTLCKIPNECQGGYCGPFNISRVYWVDAGKVILPEDDPDRNNAWKDCARDYFCSKKIIEGYLQKFGKDCNNDGVTNCYDYMMINGNGGYGCTSPLNRSANGRRWLQRYEECGNVKLTGTCLSGSVTRYLQITLDVLCIQIPIYYNRWTVKICETELISVKCTSQ